MSAMDWPAPSAEALAARYADASAEDLLRACLTEHFPGRIALLSSFGAESAVLLHMLAGIDRHAPVVFLDTGKLFPETLAYRDRLVSQLGLANLIEAHPHAERLAELDPDGLLWQRDPDMCCWQRKVEPTDEALAPYASVITGRKRFHGGIRGALPPVEQGDDGRIKVNPLVGWSRAAVDQYFADNGLPQHPLVMRNFRSIGCAPCTRATEVGEDVRAGRWAGTTKTECGIHLSRHAQDAA